MITKKALIMQGGWDGHDPSLVANRFKDILEKNNYIVEISDSLDRLSDKEELSTHDLIVFSWTMGTIDEKYVENVSYAVGKGTGLAGCHGGLCDSFRQSTQWQFITGGNWVSHPGGDNIEYMVNICHGSSPIIENIDDFKVSSEHYYLHVDPAVNVLATTRFPSPDVPYYHISNKPVDMPVAWTKFWGNGRVFYCSLGHQDNVFEKFPSAQKLMENGLVWAGEGKEFAEKNNLTTERFENKAKMY